MYSECEDVLCLPFLYFPLSGPWSGHFSGFSSPIEPLNSLFDGSLPVEEWLFGGLTGKWVDAHQVHVCA